MQLCKPMFKSSMSKGSFVHGLLSFLFTVLENRKAFHQKLLQIADSHCKKGVKAIEYGIIGEVCIYAYCTKYLCGSNLIYLFD
jgi:hemoglobin-like flavoprotein